ncbi:transmembrane protein [Cocos nucifera]|uniref:Transmembrane protein n=1 Tax=Cocos nucifera TaxID=13894 RepID=A0A8K0IIS0_COCNU|nr:transmembrane protein [Cocos nucifera]KAG1360689.1 transmembrane protein [Cocos nucifera]
MSFSTPSHLLLHAAVSAAASLLATLLHLPSLLLHGLHTYIHPDSLGGGDGDGVRAAIRRPSDAPSSSSDLRRRNRSKGHRPDFDESGAQLFRLRLADAHLRTRLYFPEYRTSFLSAAVALPNLALCSLLPRDPPASAAIPALAALVAAAHLLLALAKLSLERSSSRRSEKELSVLSGFLGFLAALLIVFHLSPSVFDFDLGKSDAAISKAAAAILAGCLSGILFIPAARAARAFWLGTDQLRWNLSVVSCSAPVQILLYAAVLSGAAVPLLWVNPVVVPAGEVQSLEFKEYRIWALMASAFSQLLVLRANLQMYLNEAVLCWYQRLHASRAPDMDYGRAKVFLHNHYLCLVALQFFAPPVLALVLLGLSQLRGNLFGGVLFLGSLVDCSDLLKEIALFIAWWIAFIWAILTMLKLALYRSGFLIVS